MKCQRSHFSLPKDIHYLNNAYLGPLPNSTVLAGISGIQLKANPIQITPKEFYTDLDENRQLFAKLINVPNKNWRYVSFCNSVCFAISTVAKNLETKITKNHNIVILHEQFPSNVYPWMRLCERTGANLKVAKPPNQSGLDRGKNWNTAILNSINEQTKLVAIEGVHWTDGTKFDLEAIGKRCKQVGAYFVVDGTQSIGVLPFDVQKFKCDVVVCAAYKWLLSGYSCAFAYYSPEFMNSLDQGGIPLEENWINRLNAYDFPNVVNYRKEYDEGAIRFDMGEKGNFTLQPMLKESLKLILEWTPEAIQEYTKRIAGDSLTKLQKAGFLIEDEKYRASHLFGIRFPDGVDVKQVQKKLKEKNIYVSVRGTAVRCSLHVYNDENDVQALVDVLLEFAKELKGSNKQNE